MSQHYLNPLFKPKSIAVFGASDRAGSVGAVVFENLRTSGFQGTLYPINPKRDEVQGVKALHALDEIAGAIDLAVIATPAETVPAIIEACGQRGVKAAVILSAGFGEIGEAGLALEQKTKETARHYSLRFIGPNCLGLMRPSGSMPHSTRAAPSPAGWRWCRNPARCVRRFWTGRR